MNDVVIVSASRTAIGRFQGALAGVSAVDLGAAVIRRLLDDTGLAPHEVDEVIMGQVLSAGAGQNPARQTAIKAGLPYTVPALTINKVCGSGLEAIHLAAQAIRCGDAEVMIAGGQESMSQAPYVLAQARQGLRMGHKELLDSMIHDGLWDAFNDYHMGITAENLAEQYGVTREQQDAYALRSQQRANTARGAGRFVDEITPVHIAQRSGEALCVDVDEQPASGASAKDLARLNRHSSRVAASPRAMHRR
jgi:acetyl-CoA C-acetyltransferase